MEVGELVHVIADAHIYDRHIPLCGGINKKRAASGTEVLVKSGSEEFL